MVEVRVAVNTEKLQNISEKLPLIQKKGLKLTGQGMISALQKNSPVDTGLLKQWFFYNYSDSSLEIRSPAQYARFVNDGTGIYNGGDIIRPKKGKFLKFEPGPKWKGPVSDDGYVYLRSVKGQKGQHFVEKSIEQTQKRIGDFFIKAIDEVL